MVLPDYATALKGGLLALYSALPSTSRRLTFSCPDGTAYIIQPQFNLCPPWQTPSHRLQLNQSTTNICTVIDLNPNIRRETFRPMPSSSNNRTAPCSRRLQSPRRGCTTARPPHQEPQTRRNRKSSEMSGNARKIKNFPSPGIRAGLQDQPLPLRLWPRKMAGNVRKCPEK